MRTGVVCLAALCLMAGAARHVSAETIALGSSALYPAFSAKEIRLLNPSAASGIYWFDPDGPGGLGAWQGYADMTTDGGGWNLALLSLAGSEVTTTDIVSNTGTVSLSTAHTRDMTLLAVNQPAQIRHEIVSVGQGTFNGFYTGQYHGTLPVLAGWTFGSGHSPSANVFLSTHFGKDWSTAAVDVDDYSGNCAVLAGQPWYYGVCYGVIPGTSADPVNGPATGGYAPLTKYAIWVRADGQTLYDNPNLEAVPEPATLTMIGLGLAAVGRRRYVARRRPADR